MELRIRSDQLGRVQAQVAGLGAKVAAADVDGRSALAVAIRKVLGEALRREAPRSTDAPEGHQHLADTIKAHVNKSVFGLRVSFDSAADYLPFVLLGTKPHIIVPRRAKVLAFSVGGQMVFAKRVSHPGTKPNRFDKRAWSRSQPEIRAGLAVYGRTVAMAFHL